ncbi:hypothetical protein [Dyella psychrodurans]|nr:hypothetical protein [Dyella psychrodurans]
MPKRKSPSSLTSEIASLEADKAARTSQKIRALLQQQPKMILTEVAQAIRCSLRKVDHASAKLQQENKLRYRGPKKCGNGQ